MKNILNSELVPRRQTKGSAGYDIYAVEDMHITSKFQTFDTGVILENEWLVLNGDDYTEDYFPGSYVALVMPRSSMGFKYGLRFANTIGVVDMDYRDTIKLSMCADHHFDIKAGERYAQIIFVPYLIDMEEDEPVKERGGGIGSTN